MRAKGADTAMTIAENFRDSDHEVLFMMDSATRYAMALREIGLAAGEPPTTKGYPPSMFAALPRLCERAGWSDINAMTAFFTVLIEGDDIHDPVGDAMRSILDGHVMLSRDLARQHHYPAVDVLGSVSRLRNDIVAGGRPRGRPPASCAGSRAWRTTAIWSTSAPTCPGADPCWTRRWRKEAEIRAFLSQDVERSDRRRRRAWPGLRAPDRGRPEMPFRFRLDRVLKIRQRVLEQRTREVAATELRVARARAATPKLSWRRRTRRLCRGRHRRGRLRPRCAGSGRPVLAFAAAAGPASGSGARRGDRPAGTGAPTSPADRSLAGCRGAQEARSERAARSGNWSRGGGKGATLDEIGGIRADRIRRSRVSA